jgi:hypothetical protein
MLVWGYIIGAQLTHSQYIVKQKKIYILNEMMQSKNVLWRQGKGKFGPLEGN